MRASADSGIVMRSSASFGLPGGSTSRSGATSSLRSFSPRAVVVIRYLPGFTVRSVGLRDRDGHVEHVVETLAHIEPAGLAADEERDRAGTQERVLRAQLRLPLLRRERGLVLVQGVGLGHSSLHHLVDRAGEAAA